MKRIGYILLVLIILLALPLFFGKRIVERIALQKIEEATGFQASVGDVDVRILRPVVRIQNLVLSNPPEFPHPEMLHIRELYVRYDWISLFGDNLHLDEVRIDVPRIVMVKPESGKSNVELLADLASGGDGGATTTSPDEPPPPAPAPSGEEQPAADEPAKRERKLTIDRLNIKLGEMEVRQYMANRPDPVIMPIPVGLDSTFTDVSDLDPVITQLSGELIFRSSVGVLSNLDSVLQAVTDENGRLDPNVREQFKDLKKLFMP
jgi:uncharacterized protein involved in outer membrane biogenesis